MSEAVPAPGGTTPPGTPPRLGGSLSPQTPSAPAHGGFPVPPDPPGPPVSPWPTWPYELRLPLAPYRFVWRDEAAVDADKQATELYTEERYRHADGTWAIIREYRADGSYHIMSDRGEIELIDNAGDPYAPDPVSVVRLP